jgi:RNA polymerase sigma-70 factor (ECF subfamily)
MRRAQGERERPDPERYGEDPAVRPEALAAAVLAALQAADVERLICALGPHPHAIVDRGLEETGAGWPFLLRSLGFADTGRTAWAQRWANGGPALVGSRDGRVVAVVVLAGALGAATDVWIVANPDKLRRWDASSC